MKLKQIGLLVATCIGIFLCLLDTTVMNIALPAIQSAMHVPLNSLSWALNAYTIIFAVLTIPLGRIADLVGRNKVYLIGMGFFAIGSIISATSGEPINLTLGRAVQSLGAAIVFPTSMTIALASTDLKGRQFVLLLMGLMQGLASALGPTIGGIVTQFMGWRWVFYINLPLLLIAFLICLWVLPLRNEKRISAKIDWLGMWLSITTLLSLTIALTQGNTWGWQSFSVWGLLILFVISLVTFIWWERRANAPMIPMDLFKDRQFNGAALALVLCNFFFTAVMVLLPTYFTKVQNKTELLAALMVTPITAMVFVFSPIAGTLVSKAGPRMVIGLGYLAMIGGYIGFSIANPNNYGQLVIANLLLGSGFGIIIGPITVLAAADFTGELLTASQSVSGVLRQVGSVLAIAIFVSLLTTNITNAKQTSWQHAESTITTLNVDQAAKKIMRTKIKQQLIGDGADSASTSVNNNQGGLSKGQRQALISKNTQQVLAQQNGLSLPKAAQLQVAKAVQTKLLANPQIAKLPAAAQQTLIQQQTKKTLTSMTGTQLPLAYRQSVKKAVTKRVDQRIKTTNQKVARAVVNIKGYTKNQLNDSFFSLYRWALPVLILASFSTFLFYRKQDYVQRMQATR